MAFDREQHHRRSIRLQGYDYSRPGAYFVTMVSHMRECLFGYVTGGRVTLNAFGEIVADEWKKSGDIRKNMEFDVFVIMPNHVHGIVHIVDRRGDRRVAPTMPDAPLTPAKHLLPSFVSGFKSVVTKRINELRRMPGMAVWQRNYYEHIIRDEVSLNRIREYIINNPLQWDSDPENPMATKTDRNNL